MWQVVIPEFVIPSVNRLLNTERYIRAKIKRQATDMILTYCHLAKVPLAKGKRRVGFLVQLDDMRKAPDPDNCWKILLDALVVGGFLRDDRAEWVELGFSFVRKGLFTQTIICIEDIDGKSTNGSDGPFCGALDRPAPP